MESTASTGTTRVGQLVGQRRDLVSVTPSDLDEVDATEAAEDAGMARAWTPLPITDTTAEPGRASSRVATAEPAAVRVAVM